MISVRVVVVVVVVGGGDPSPVLSPSPLASSRRNLRPSGPHPSFPGALDFSIGKFPAIPPLQNMCAAAQKGKARGERYRVTLSPARTAKGWLRPFYPELWGA